MNKLPLFKKVSQGDIRFDKGPSQKYLNSISLFIFIFSVFIVFTVLVFRLFQLTVVKGEYYRRLSEENRVREILIEPKRGKILDRKGLIIAESTVPDLQKVDERIKSGRIYQEPEAIASIIGYRQTADKEAIDNSSCLIKPRLNDKVGKKGIEKIYECDLRGVSGKKLVELDAHGKYVKTLSVLEPRDGKTIKLALDLDLQKKAYEALGSRKGAVIGIKPQTGEILTFVSSPSYNPQDFEDENSQKIKDYLNDEDRPLFNRASQGLYPPGSIFKIIIAAGALQDKKIDEKTVFEDTGKIKAGPLEFGNWYFLQYGKTEGAVDVIKGLKRSNDIFFYRVGEKLGPERVKFWGEKFGLAKKSNFPLEQSEGIIPSPFWKEEVIKDRWYLGDSYNLAIGQGYIQITPLQTALMTAAIANNGTLCQPTLMKDVGIKCRSLNLSKKTLDLVQEGMKQACESGGTGWPFFEFGVREEVGTKKIITDEATASAKFGIRRIHVGCKTGTAENHEKSGIPHAWFTVFAPYENPEIVLSVIVEEAGQGSDVAAPIAKEVLKTYFERKE